jgi:hypothetical protein
MTFDKKSNIWVTRPADRKLNGGGSRVFQSLPSNPIHSPYKHNHLALFRTIQKQSPSTARIRAPTQANGRYAPCRNFTAASLPLQRPRAHATDSLFTYEKGARAAVKKPAASASASRTGKINKKQIFVFPWSPPLPPPRNPSFRPPPRRRRRAMAKSRPPKQILDSYTIKGSDKVIKREASPFAPLSSSCAPADPGFLAVGGFCTRVSVSAPWGSGGGLSSGLIDVVTKWLAHFDRSVFVVSRPRRYFGQSSLLLPRMKFHLLNSHCVELRNNQGWDRVPRKGLIILGERWHHSQSFCAL